LSTLTEKRPNVLWISFEDTSPRFGCYGDKLAKTPVMDQLAADGQMYTNAFSTAGVCSPSRCAVITGMYAQSIGAHHHRTTTPRHTTHLPTPYEAVPPAYVKLLPEYLRANGYFCSNNAKTDYQFTAPFTAWDDQGASAHWRNRDGNQPFFSVFNIGVTHESGMWKDVAEVETDPEKVHLPPYLPNTTKCRRAVAIHYDNLAKADKIAGQLLEQLEEDGLAQDTIVFIWSDHGEGIPRSKRWLYDSGTRVPLLLRWPGHISSGTTSDQLVSMIDLAPTVLSLLGLPIPSHFQGQAFLGQKAQSRKFVYAGRDRHDECYDMVRAVRDSRYKYIRNYHPEKPYFDWTPYGHQHAIMQEMWRLHAEDGLTPLESSLMSDGRPPEELYDCITDPHEICNLAEHPDYLIIQEKMRKELDAWRSQINDLGDIPEEQIVHRMWPGGVQPLTAPVQFVIMNKEHTGEEPMPSCEDAFICPSPTLLMLYCATQGASIAYTFDQGKHVQWQLYTSPFRLPVGKLSVRAKSVRIGYKPSEETNVLFEVIE
jgi:N-sulfoglucosamine sulfohydrolase